MGIKLLVTGGCGFIGHHFCEHIIKNTDWDLIVLDKLTYASEGFDRLRDISVFDNKRVKILTCDFAKPISEGVTQEIGQVDYIVHMGAETHVDRSLEDPMPFAMSNVMGTTRLLQWIRATQKNLKKYIQFSTDEVYGPAPEGVFYKEWDLMQPSNPYAASKGGADLMAISFAFAYKMPIMITRTMNVIGERQHPEKFLPKTLRAIEKGEKVILHGQPDKLSSRCWIHARNVAAAILFLINNGETLEKGKKQGMYHIVGEERNVKEIADIISQVLNKRPLSNEEITFVDFHSAREGHDFRYALDGARLKEKGFKMPVSLEASLKKTIEWSLANRRWL